MWLVILSFGYVDALIPLLVIVILIATAAGLTRGWDALKIFGIEALMGVGVGGKGSLRGKSAYKPKYLSLSIPQATKVRPMLAASGAVANAKERLNRSKGRKELTNSLMQPGASDAKTGAAAAGAAAKATQTSGMSSGQKSQVQMAVNNEKKWTKRKVAAVAATAAVSATGVGAFTAFTTYGKRRDAKKAKEDRAKLESAQDSSIVSYRTAKENGDKEGMQKAAFEMQTGRMKQGNMSKGKVWKDDIPKGADERESAGDAIEYLKAHPEAAGGSPKDAKAMFMHFEKVQNLEKERARIDGMNLSTAAKEKKMAALAKRYTDSRYKDELFGAAILGTAATAYMKEAKSGQDMKYKEIETALGSAPPASAVGGAGGFFARRRQARDQRIKAFGEKKEEIKEFKKTEKRFRKLGDDGVNTPAKPKITMRARMRNASDRATNFAVDHPVATAIAPLTLPFYAASAAAKRTERGVGTAMRGGTRGIKQRITREWLEKDSENMWKKDDAGKLIGLKKPDSEFDDYWKKNGDRYKGIVKESNIKKGAGSVEKGAEEDEDGAKRLALMEYRRSTVGSVLAAGTGISAKGVVNTKGIPFVEPKKEDYEAFEAVKDMKDPNSAFRNESKAELSYENTFKNMQGYELAKKKGIKEPKPEDIEEQLRKLEDRFKDRRTR